MSEASRELNIDRKTLRTWVSNLEKMSQMGKKRAKRRLEGGGRNAQLPDLEKELFAWFEQQRRARMVVSYRRLREEAIRLCGEMDLDDSEAVFSDKWIYNFTRRHNIRFVHHQIL